MAGGSLTHTLHPAKPQSLKGTRKFYLHTADGKLLSAIAEVNSRTGKKYVTLPDRIPDSEEAVWYDVLSKVNARACAPGARRPRRRPSPPPRDPQPSTPAA
jgi:hypothetical protein